MRELVDVIIPATSKPEVKLVVDHLDNFADIIGNIIVVDFNRIEPSLSFGVTGGLKPLNINLKYVFVDDERYFNKSKALNIGAGLSSSSLLLICDADVLLDKSFFSVATVLSANESAEAIFYTPEYVEESDTGERRPAPGICMLRRKDYVVIDGYCNEYRGWGMEDMDFLTRLDKASIKRKLHSFGIHLSHPNEDRTKNYHSESVQEMRKENRLRYAEKVNNLQLYGTLSSDITNCQYTEC